MLIEDRLTGNRVHRPVGREHAMGHAAAEPEPSAARRDSRRRPCDARPRAVGDLAQRVRFAAGLHTAASRPVRGRSIRRSVPAASSTASARLAIGPSTISITFQSMPGNLRPTHVPPPWAQALPGFAEHSRWRRSTPPAATRSRRRACARRRSAAIEPFIRASTCGGTGAPADNTRASVGKLHVVLLAVLTDAVPDGRRAERLRDLPVAARPRRCCADRPRPGARIHVRNDRRHAHRAVEQAEQRKARPGRSRRAGSRRTSRISVTWRSKLPWR